MKVYLLPVIALCTLLLTSCKNEKKPLVKEYNTRIAYYPKGHENYKHVEVTGVKRIMGDSTIFVYSYSELSQNNDTLIIKNDSAWFNRNLLKLVGEKNLTYKDTVCLVAKCHYQPLSAYGNLYINDSLGLVFARLGTQPQGEAFIFYNTDEYSSLHEAIANDSAFYEYTK